MAFKWIYDKIASGFGVRKTLAAAPEHIGISKSLAYKLYAIPEYPFSPFYIYDEITGEIVGERTAEQILQRAIEIERENSATVESKPEAA